VSDERAWRELGIAETWDFREIRRAYARRLKVTHPEDDAEGFRRLRAAYEYVMSVAAHAVQQQSAAQGEAPPAAPAPTAVAEPASAVGDDAAPAAPVVPPADLEMREIATLYDALGSRLTKSAADGWPDTDADRRALRALLDSPALQRIDLQLRVEYGVAAMLVDNIPHADHLLAAAVRHFEWDRRQHESSLPDAARGVLARLHDLAFLDHLRQSNNEQTRAYDSLKTGSTGPGRWWTAGFLRIHPELQMLEHLRQFHPQLLAELPRKTIEWWERFTRWPRPSRFLGYITVIVTALMALIVGFGGAGEPDHAGRVFGMTVLTLSALIGFMAAKYFAIDVPAMRLYLRWNRSPPTPYALGWLGPAAIVLFGAIAARDQAWAPYTFAVGGALTWYWTLLVSGPVPELQWGGNALSNRPIRVFAMNLLMLWWLLITLGAALLLNPWLLLACSLVLAASGTSRPLLMHVYLERLHAKGQLLAAGAGLLLATTLAIVACVYGREADFRPWLIAAVTLLVILRRAIPHGIMISSHWLSAVAVVVLGWASCTVVATSLKLDVSFNEYEDPPPIVSGALFFTMGAVYAFARAMIDAVRALRIRAA
jgi:hypothetical protein